jgi:aldose 1-epimerase
MTHSSDAGSGAPTCPPGWEHAAETLLMLTDPNGDAVAWVCPELGANVVALAVKTERGWKHVLHQDGPANLRERPSRFGLPILFPFPGHMVGGRYRWQGVEYVMPMLNPSAPSYTHGFAHQRPWRVTHHASTAVFAVLDTRTDLEPEQRAGYPFDLTLALEVSLAYGALTVTLAAANVGSVEAPVGIGLHPYFDPAFFSDRDRTALSVQLPGQRARQLTSNPPIPTGASQPAQPGAAITPVALGRQMLVSRTDFGDGRTASIVGRDAAAGSSVVELGMDVGWEDVLLFAPFDGPSISLEPHTGAPGAASLPEGDPDGLRGLAPGQRLEVRASIRARGRTA